MFEHSRDPNLETNTTRLLQVLLVGQLGLLDVLPGRHAPARSAHLTPRKAEAVDADRGRSLRRTPAVDRAQHVCGEVRTRRPRRDNALTNGTPSINLLAIAP
jgi:hypothetical protein